MANSMSPRCECGNMKRREVEGCDRCRRIDAQRMGTTAIMLRKLRSLGVASAIELAEAVNKTPSTVTSWLNSKAKVGLVRRATSEHIHRGYVTWEVVR